MKCKPFRDINELKSGFDTFTEAYAEFLQSGNVPRSLEQDYSDCSNTGHHHQMLLKMKKYVHVYLM